MTMTTIDHQKGVALHHHLLPPLRHVRHGLLDQFPHPPRRGARQVGTRDTVQGIHQQIHTSGWRSSSQYSWSSSTSSTPSQQTSQRQKVERLKTNIQIWIDTTHPSVLGLTAIEAWVIGCVLFVFGALIGIKTSTELKMCSMFRPFSLLDRQND